MADSKITALPEATESDIELTDLVPVVDDVATTPVTKKMTVENFRDMMVDRFAEKIAALAEATESDIATTDVLYIVDNVVTTPVSKKITVENFRDLITTLIGTRFYHSLCFYYTEDVNIGDGAGYVHITSDFNGWNLTYARARVITAGTTNNTEIQIANVTDGVDMLSTKLTIASGATLDDGNRVIDTTKDDVATDDLLRIDVDATSTTKPKGLIAVLGFTRP